MIILDVNILLYAFNAKCVEHAPTLRWLEETVQSEEIICLPWITVLGFLRLSTNAAIYNPPYTINEALIVLEDLLKNSNVQVIEPTTISLRDFKTISVETRITSRLLTDAYLASLALQSGSTLVSADLDFARFQPLGLKWFNPLQPGHVAERTRNRYTTNPRAPRRLHRRKSKKA